MMEQKKGLIYERIPLVMKSIGSITKQRRNKQQNYAFRGIDDIYNELHRHLVQNQVFVTSEVINQVREERESKSGGMLVYTVLTVKFTFWTTDGSSITSTLVGEAMDSGDKSSNKAMSTAYKYAFMQIFCIPTNEAKDTEEVSPDPMPRKQKLTTKKDVFTDNTLKRLQGKLANGENVLLENITNNYTLSDDMMATVTQLLAVS